MLSLLKRWRTRPSISAHFLRVKHVTFETEDAATIDLEPADGTKLNYVAGQFISLKLVENSATTIRQYSFSSAPGIDERLAVTIKRVPGGKWSNFLLDRVVPGNLLEFEPARGSFVLPEPAPTQIVLFAAGSGITPVYSMLKAYLAAPDSARRATLIYSTRTRSNTIFLSALTVLAERDSRFKLELFASQHEDVPQRRRLSAPAVQESLARIASQDALFYICGAPSYVNDVKAGLELAGVSEEQIKAEAFVSSPSGVSSFVVAATVAPRLIGQPVRLHFTHGRETIEVASDDGATILEAALEAKQAVSWACKNGVCGSCEMKLNQGRVQTPDGLLQPGAKFLSCVAHAASKEVACTF